MHLETLPLPALQDGQKTLDHDDLTSKEALNKKHQENLAYAQANPGLPADRDKKRIW